MKTNKKVLSLLLALVMVFSTAVTAFAAQGVTPAEKFKITATADKNNALEGADINLTIKKAAAGTTVYTKVDDLEVKNGKGEKEVTLEPNMDYGVWANNPKEVLQGSSYYYTFSTDAEGKVKSDLPTFHFKLAFEGLNNEKITVYSLNADGKAKGNVKFDVYPVKVGTDGLYEAGKDKAFVADVAEDGSNKLNINTFETDKYGILGIDESAIGAMIVKAGYKVQGTTVVAFVVNGEAVAYCDLVNDEVVVLREVKKNVKVEVTVLGFDRTTAKPAIEGATVEIQPNTTKIFEDETFGEAVQSLTTDKNGKVVFENVEPSSILSFLNNTKPYNVMNITKPDNVMNITRVNRVAVTKAAGYQVPEYKLLDDVVKVSDTLYKMTFELIPEGYNYIARINGASRYATSVEVARATYGTSKTSVILASGDVYADALVANGLVGLNDVPLLLTGKATLDKTVEKYLDDAKVKEVLIIGGIGSVSGTVQAKLEAMGIRVARIAGSNRYDTSVKVLDAYIKLDSGLIFENVLLASGENFADALVASVPSALYKQPILLTESKALSAPVKAAFNNPAYKIGNVIVVGGNSSVSDNAVAEIGLIAVERLSGQNRQLTSMIVANKFFTNGGQAVIADGTGFADALSAGQYAVKKNAPILLTESKTSAGKDLTEYIKTNKMTQLTIVGGQGSVSKTVADQLETILAGK